jgi:hypothetical protein
MKLARSCEDLLSPPHPRPASKWAISPRTVQSHFVTHPAPPLPGIWAAPTSRLRRLGRAQPPQDYLEAKRAAGYYPEANPAAARPWGGEAGRRLLLERWQAGEREGRGPLRLWSRALAPARPSTTLDHYAPLIPRDLEEWLSPDPRGTGALGQPAGSQRGGGTTGHPRQITSGN